MPAFVYNLQLSEQMKEHLCSPYNLNFHHSQLFQFPLILHEFFFSYITPLQWSWQLRVLSFEIPHVDDGSAHLDLIASLETLFCFWSCGQSGVAFSACMSASITSKTHNVSDLLWKLRFMKQLWNFHWKQNHFFLCQWCIQRLSDVDILVWAPKLCAQIKEKLMQNNNYIIISLMQMRLHLLRHLIRATHSKLLN